MECTTSSVPLAKKIFGDGNLLSFYIFFSFSIITFLLKVLLLDLCLDWWALNIQE